MRKADLRVVGIMAQQGYDVICLILFVYFIFIFLLLHYWGVCFGEGDYWGLRLGSGEGQVNLHIC